MLHTSDLLIHSATQLVTCASPAGPKRGRDMADVGSFEDGAIAIQDGRIVAVGTSSEIRAAYTATETIDAQGKVVCPAFVDPHTHVVYGGDRVGEFELRVQGASYMELMAAGGGIRSTMWHTRAASEAALIASARQRLDEMLALGTLTVEVKSGYGLDTVTELKMLRVIERLDLLHPCTLVPTFLGAHTLPPEYKDDASGYVGLVVAEMIPAVADWYAASHFKKHATPLFIDVFCEAHAFDVTQARRILQAGQVAGMRPKIHADQFNALGGVQVAADLDAISADHLDVTGAEGQQLLAQSDMVGVLLPAVNFNLGHTHFADGRGLVDAGAAVALATDLNPGSAPCYAMPLVMAIANRYLRLSPAESLNAATINAAYAMGMAHQVGSIEVGKSADLLILKAGDYRHISYFLGGNPVETVVKAGCRVCAG